MKKVIKLALLLVPGMIFQVPEGGAADDSGTAELVFSPVLLDSQDAVKSTIGIDFRYADKILFALGEGDAGSADFDADAIDSKGKLAWSIRGIAAIDDTANPKNFIESRLDGSYFRGQIKFNFDAGLFAKYENDQSLDNAQSVYGVKATFGAGDLLFDNDLFALHYNLGQVDPKDDGAREAALGSDLDTYDRWDIEFWYKIVVGKGSIDALEINLRYFQEIDAPSAIRDADIDQHRLSTIRIDLRDNIYLAYSSGKLPFDRESDQIVELGFTHNLEELIQ